MSTFVDLFERVLTKEGIFVTLVVAICLVYVYETREEKLAIRDERTLIITRQIELFDSIANGINQQLDIDKERADATAAFVQIMKQRNERMADQVRIMGIIASKMNCSGGPGR